ncbi:MAG: hypothetical protein R3C97_14965 [Geminicoccaceae bacterium]
MRGHGEDALVHEAGVLDIVAEPVGHQDGLALKRDGLLSEASRWIRKIARANVGEPFERIVFPGIFLVAIGPFIVAGCVDESAFEPVHVVELSVEGLVRATAVAGFGVTDMQGEVRLGAVDFLDERLIGVLNAARLSIGRIAEGGEAKGVGARLRGGKKKRCCDRDGDSGHEKSPNHSKWSSTAGDNLKNALLDEGSVIFAKKAPCRRSPVLCRWLPAGRRARRGAMRQGLW